MIPKIIHQINLNYDLNKKFIFLKNKLLENNYNYNYKLWTNLDINNLIKNNYSEKLFDKYKKCFNHQIRMFIAKCCIINSYGGIFIDTNLLILKNLDNLINKQCFLISDYFDYINYDFFLASESENFILNRIIKSLLSFSDLDKIDLKNFFNNERGIVRTNYDKYKLNKLVFTSLSKNDFLFLIFTKSKKQKKFIIYKKCMLSKGIYLYDNDWYQNSIVKYNHIIEVIDIFKKIENMFKLKKISCICVINNIDKIKNIIKCFKSQTYENKELLLIINGDKNKITKLLKSNISILENVNLKLIDNNIYDTNEFNPIQVEDKKKINLDLEFYKKYLDLKRLPDWKIKYHWNSHGINENRINSIEMFNKIYPKADLKKYKRNQKINKVFLKSKDDYAIHFHKNLYKFKKKQTKKYKSINDPYEILYEKKKILEQIDTDYLVFLNENDLYNFNYLLNLFLSIKNKDCCVFNHTLDYNSGDLYHYAGYFFGFMIKYEILMEIFNNEQNEWQEWIDTKIERNQDNVSNILYILHRFRLLENTRKIEFISNKKNYIIHP